MNRITIIFTSELKQLNSEHHLIGRLCSEELMQLNMADRQNINRDTKTNTASTTMIIQQHDHLHALNLSAITYTVEIKLNGSR